MDLKKCEVFVRAIDTGSFSKAAEQSGYTPSGVAHMMNALEDEIGFPLLVRGHRGVTATENGQSCYQYCGNCYVGMSSSCRPQQKSTALKPVPLRSALIPALQLIGYPRLLRRSERIIRILKST